MISSATEEREDEEGLDPISIHDSVDSKIIVSAEVEVEGAASTARSGKGKKARVAYRPSAAVWKAVRQRV